VSLFFFAHNRGAGLAPIFWDFGSFVTSGCLTVRVGAWSPAQSPFPKVQVMRYNGRRRQHELTGAIQIMMRREAFEIANIYVPVKRRSTLDPEVVRQIAESMLESGQETPILVRRDGDRLVLVHGLHRLEACRALGEKTILGYIVQAQKH
jgi:sulfiredoxin